MSWFRGRNLTGESADIAAHTYEHVRSVSLAGILSGVALLFSGFSLWESSLKAADVRLFVPPTIFYSSPYQNSNFEMFSVPLTLTNEGARTGTILSMELAVTDPRTKQTKRFYAAEFGRWTMDKTRAGAYEQFAPISLAGRESRTVAVLFYTRGDAEKPDELVREVGPYEFKLTAEQAEGGGIARAGGMSPSVSFVRSLRFFDARSFQNGTIPMDAADWRSSSNAPSPAP